MASYNRDGLVKRQDLNDLNASIKVNADKIVDINKGVLTAGQAVNSNESIHAVSADSTAYCEMSKKLGNLRVFQEATEYALGDICYRGDLPTNAYLECIVPGITDATSTSKEGTVTLIEMNPITYERNELWRSTDEVLLVSPSWMKLVINNQCFVTNSAVTINVNDESIWDDATYATPANRAGKDCYIYGIIKRGALNFILSMDDETPAEYDLTTARKLGGFHCLCMDVGTIANHPLSGYVAGDVLPASVWDLNHRPLSDPKGMVFIDGLNLWVDIYLNTWEGTAAKGDVKLLSKYQETIADGTSTEKFNGIKFKQTYGEQKKRLPYAAEFRVFALGSNTTTTIKSAADPVTSGGHTDTAGRRMISYYGVEDCCGTMWQWGNDSYSDFGVVSDTDISIDVNNIKGYTNADRSDAIGSCIGIEYQVALGDNWANKGQYAGPRGASWYNDTLTFSESYGARGVSESYYINNTNVIKMDTCRIADKATALETPRTITFTGAINGSATFDGTSDITIETSAISLPTSDTGGNIWIS